MYCFFKVVFNPFYGTMDYVSICDCYSFEMAEQIAVMLSQDTSNKYIVAELINGEYVENKYLNYSNFLNAELLNN